MGVKHGVAVSSGFAALHVAMMAAGIPWAVTSLYLTEARVLHRHAATVVITATLTAATDGLEVTVAYTHTPRPFDAAGLRAVAGTDVVLVEPYLAGTSARVVADALADRPHLLLGLGVTRTDLRLYGSPADHERWHGLDAASIRGAVDRFITD